MRSSKYCFFSITAVLYLCDFLSSQLQDASVKIRELTEENAKLQKEINEPSTKKRLYFCFL